VQLIDQWLVSRSDGARGPASIQLLVGDLANMPAEHAVDALVVSAFPDSYTPNPGTLFASLLNRGLDMEQVAKRKAEDERSRLGCWISKPLPKKLARSFHFDRIICFEPRYHEFVKNTHWNPESPQDAVAFVFRCLNNFAAADPDGRQRFKLTKLAMPLLATGNQAIPVEDLLPRLLESAVFWLEAGLPVDELKVVAFSSKDVAVAKQIFRAAKTGYRPKRRTPPKPSQVKAPGITAAGQKKGYDFFVSYSHKQEAEVLQFVKALKATSPRPKVFFDRTSIPQGGLWIKALSDAIRDARTFVAVLSPDYSSSLVCWDEFQCAKLKEYNDRKPVIKTIRLFSDSNLPPIMGIHSYIDCAEGDLRKLRRAASLLRSKS